MKIEIRETLDGSHTLYQESIDEHYHSSFGAIQESQHIFIQEGLTQIQTNAICILEIGFGSGLNCYLTLLASQKSSKVIRYYSIEKYPLPASIWEELNYSDLCHDKGSDHFSSIHRAPWNSEVEIAPQFILQKIEADLMSVNLSVLPLVDVVYYDAFSPEKQPELWEISIFERIFDIMNLNGILVTYCAKGSIRRILQSVGFQVERIPGPPGKREMIRAKKLKIKN